MPAAPVELLLIRHAEADHGGRLVGRTDVPAILPPTQRLERLRKTLEDVGAVACSPALRCRMTADALFPGQQPQVIPELWEQDFGDQDGLPYDALPDLGVLPLDELAAYRPPKGESFLDMCARVEPALQAVVAGAEEAERCVVVAHAGTVRAALGLALQSPELALKFEVAPLSGTLLRWHETGVSIVSTNCEPGQ